MLQGYPKGSGSREEPPFPNPYEIHTFAYFVVRTISEFDFHSNTWIESREITAEDSHDPGVRWLGHCPDFDLAVAVAEERLDWYRGSRADCTFQAGQGHLTDPVIWCKTVVRSDLYGRQNGRCRIEIARSRPKEDMR